MPRGSTFYQDLGRRLRQARLKLGLSQAEVANALGLSEPGYSRYETAERRMPAADLARAARVLDQPIQYFYGIDPAPDDVALQKWVRLPRVLRDDVARYVDFVLDRTPD